MSWSRQWPPSSQTGQSCGWLSIRHSITIAAELRRLGVGGGDHHPVLGLDHAAHLHALDRALHERHRAHPAGADRPQGGVVAEARDHDPEAFGGLDHLGAGSGPRSRARRWSAWAYGRPSRSGDVPRRCELARRSGVPAGRGRPGRGCAPGARPRSARAGSPGAPPPPGRRRSRRGRCGPSSARAWGRTPGSPLAGLDARRGGRGCRAAPRGRACTSRRTRARRTPSGSGSRRPCRCAGRAP